jgi:hypothetical protein
MKEIGIFAMAGKFFSRLAGAILAALGLTCGCSAQTSQQGEAIRIGKDTTVLSEPLRGDGTIDYVRAINARQSDGVTPQNNAAIPLIQAVGPDIYPEPARPAAFEQLGVEVPPAKGNYIVDWSACVWDHEFKAGHLDVMPTAKFDEFPSPDPEMLKLDSTASTRLWTDKDYPLLAQCILANERPLALIVEASRRPGMFLPIETSVQDGRMFDLVMPVYAGVRGAGRLLLARATNKAGNGDIDGAMDDVLACHRLATQISQCYTMIEKLVGYFMDREASQAGMTILRSGKVNQAQARRMLTELQAVAPLESPMITQTQGERYVALDMAAVLATQGFERTIEHIANRTNMSVYSGQPAVQEKLTLAKAETSVNWNDVLIRVNAMYDRYIPACQQQTYAQRQKAIKAVDAEVEKIQRRMGINQGLVPYEFAHKKTIYKDYMSAIRKKDVANGIIAVVGASLGRPMELWCAMSTRRQLVEVGWALEIFKAGNGKYPSELAELTPAILKQVPIDVFADKPLIYKQIGSGYLLYSIGCDMKDDGGKDDGMSGDGDIALKME